MHPHKFGCTPKNEGKRVHVPPDEKTCGHAAMSSVNDINTMSSVNNINKMSSVNDINKMSHQSIVLKKD